VRARRGLRTRLRVNYTILRANYQEYPALVALAASVGATELHPMPVDDSADRNGHRLSRRLIDDYNQRIAPLVLEERSRAGLSTDERFVYPFGRGRHAEGESAAGNYAGGYYRDRLCYAPYTHLFVAWDGKVYLCCMTNEKIEPLGDLSVEHVADVFRGERFQAMRRRMERERLDACHRCDMFLDENRTLDAALRRLPLARSG
jgi:radical SAM protein with 4Fe4S-binding SPASM domain